MNNFVKLILYFIFSSLILFPLGFCFSNTIKIGMSLLLSGKYPSGKKVINSFFILYNEHLCYHAATAYGGGMILEAAILKAGSPDHEILRETLLKIDDTTLIGRYGVDKYDKQKRHFPLIIQWQKGKKEIVWPDEIKTSNPVFN